MEIFGKVGGGWRRGTGWQGRAESGCSPDCETVTCLERGRSRIAFRRKGHISVGDLLHAMPPLTKLKIALAALAVALIVGGIVLFTSFGMNDDHTWTFVQTMTGKTTVINTAGPYWKGFGRAWHYERNMQVDFTKAGDFGSTSSADDSVRVTFNDGGTARISSVIRVAMPHSEPEQRAFHRSFGGNMMNVERAIYAHLANCIKAAGPVMSASENQASRKAEFAQIVEQQLNEGLFKMRRVERTLLDQLDKDGKPVMVLATEVVHGADGKPIVIQASPLRELGLLVTQFSITETEYDQSTQQQFEAKKQSFLAAEQSKAQREAETQRRFMVVEQGRREMAEYESKANKEAASAKIDAERNKSVAGTKADQEKQVATTRADQEKQVAITEATKETEVAKLAKLKAETEAAQKVAVAELEFKAAELRAKAMKIIAEAEAEQIAKAGKVTEKDRLALEVQRDTQIGVAKELSRIAVPAVVIGGDSGKDGAPALQNLLSLQMLQNMGVIKPDAFKPAKEAK